MSLARMQGKSQQSLVVCSMPYNLQSRRIECSGSILKSRLSLLYRNMLWSVVLELGAPRAVSLESAGESGVWSLCPREFFWRLDFAVPELFFFSKSSGIPLLYTGNSRYTGYSRYTGQKCPVYRECTKNQLL